MMPADIGDYCAVLFRAAYQNGSIAPVDLQHAYQIALDKNALQLETLPKLCDVTAQPEATKLHIKLCRSRLHC